MKQKTTILIVFLIFFSPFTLTTAYSDNNSNQFDFITYRSYVRIEIDTSLANNPLPLGKSTTLPLTITYSTDISTNFLKFVPSGIRNKFLFGSRVAPTQTIHLEIEDVPSWADIYVSEEDTEVDIPFDDEIKEVETNLIISLNEDAPAFGYMIKIIATCSTIGRLSGCEIQAILTFTPNYNPCITISGEDTITLMQNETRNITMSVTNCGNKISRVTPIIVINSTEIAYNITPSFQDIGIDNSSSFTLKITPSKSIQGNETIEIIFNTAPYPTGSFANENNDSFFVKTTMIPIDENDESLLPILAIAGIIVVCVILLIFLNKKYNIFKR